MIAAMLWSRREAIEKSFKPSNKVCDKTENPVVPVVKEILISRQLFCKALANSSNTEPLIDRGEAYNTLKNIMTSIFCRKYKRTIL